jgi:hypothetical protein
MPLVRLHPALILECCAQNLVRQEKGLAYHSPSLRVDGGVRSGSWVVVEKALRFEAGRFAVYRN